MEKGNSLEGLVKTRITNLNDIPSRKKSNEINPLLNILETNEGNKIVGELFEEVENLFKEGFYTGDANLYLKKYGLKSDNGSYFQMMKYRGILKGEQSETSHWKFKLNKESKEYKEFLDLKSKGKLPKSPLYMSEKNISKMENYSSNLDFNEINEYMGRINIQGILRANEIKTYQNLKEIGSNNLLKFRGFGRDMHRKFIAYLKEKGFSF